VCERWAWYVGEDLYELHIGERHAPCKLIWDGGGGAAQLDDACLKGELDGDRVGARCTCGRDAEAAVGDG
jgi:hypothetical protein